jgi:hypothetical protein
MHYRHEHAALARTYSMGTKNMKRKKDLKLKKQKEEK